MTQSDLILPDFKIVAIDMSWAYDEREDGTLDVGGDVRPASLWELHLVDMNRRVYCCSTSPSLELFFLQNLVGWPETYEFEDESPEQKFEDDIRYDNGGQRVSYVDVSGPDRIFLDLLNESTLPKNMPRDETYGYSDYDELQRAVEDSVHEALATGAITAYVDNKTMILE